MLSAQLEILLPNLRRFAYACTDDLPMADRCVEEALNNLLSEGNIARFETVDSYQVYLYRLVEEALKKACGTSFRKKTWRALILVLVEGLTRRETAQILSTSIEEIDVLIAAAETKPIQTVERQ